MTRFRVSYNVPTGMPSGSVKMLVLGQVYEADSFEVDGVGSLALWAHVEGITQKRLVYLFAPGTWRTISPEKAVGASTEPQQPNSEDPRRDAQARS
jgi:hypothetical protein